VEPEKLGTMFMALSVMDTTGTLLAGPLVALAFKVGIHLGNLWHGMPYLLSFSLCSIATLVMAKVRLNSQRVEDPRTEGYGSFSSGNDSEDSADRER
jgi:hypothetical protein